MGRRERKVLSEDMNNLSIGQLMRLSRNSKPISLTNMANLLGYSRGYLSMIENGHKQPPLELVISYERILGLESGQLSQALQPSQIEALAVGQVFDFDIEQGPVYQNQFSLLAKGVKLWNQWREGNPEIRPFLARMDLNEAHLDGSNFNSADLTRVNLRKARLNKADLSTAVLRQANMNGADLSGANLSRAYLNAAKLCSANLSEANLSEANLSGADLSEANLSGADLSEANLSGANLNGAFLYEADLTRTNLTGADLEMVSFEGAIISNTIFGDVDLSKAIGLEAVKHTGPSVIGIDTFVRSQAKIPEDFLRLAGVNDIFITYMRSLINSPIEYHTCFMSYSSKDQDFAEHLYADLKKRGIRCWFAPEDMKIGDTIASRIDESIKLSDKLIVILSEHSIASSWVAMEIEAALEKEQQQNKVVLYPIRLDNAVMLASHGWIDNLRGTRNIGDFTKWKEPEEYQRAFRRLLRDLNALPKSVIGLDMAFRAEQAVFKWLLESYPQVKRNKESGMPDFICEDNNGSKVGVEVKYFVHEFGLKSKLKELNELLKKKQARFDKLLVIAVFTDELVAKKAALSLDSVGSGVTDTSHIVGYFEDGAFYRIEVHPF